MKKQPLAINVSIPEIKLTLADLSFLRSVEGGGQHYCTPARGVIDRLTFMGLIVRVQIPPCPKDVQKHEETVAAAWVKAAEALRKHDANMLERAGNDLTRYAPHARDGYLLTKAGRGILARGKARALVAGRGCVK